MKSQSSVDKLPINLELWRNSNEIVKAVCQLHSRPTSGNAFKLLVTEWYFTAIKNCANETDIKKLINDYKRMGWIPKSTNTKKRKSHVRNHKAQAG